MYIAAGLAIALSRWPRFAARQKSLAIAAALAGLAAIALHAWILVAEFTPASAAALSLGTAASFVGLQLAVTAAIGSAEPALRGLAGGLLVLAGLCAALTGTGTEGAALHAAGWQIQAHVLISLFAYGLLTVGAIVALYALVQDRRLRSGRLSPVNQVFAPLDTTERLMFGVTTTGFLVLMLAVFSGLVFVENLFAQHLVHKTVLSFAALGLFGVLLAGRRFAGWRGRRAVYLYLWGFVMLLLAYFGSRYILESVLGRTWG